MHVGCTVQIHRDVAVHKEELGNTGGKGRPFHEFVFLGHDHNS